MLLKVFANAEIVPFHCTSIDWNEVEILDGKLYCALRYIDKKSQINYVPIALCKLYNKIPTFYGIQSLLDFKKIFKEIEQTIIDTDDSIIYHSQYGYLNLTFDVPGIIADMNSKRKSIEDIITYVLKDRVYSETEIMLKQNIQKVGKANIDWNKFVQQDFSKDVWLLDIIFLKNNTISSANKKVSLNIDNLVKMYNKKNQKLDLVALKNELELRVKGISTLYQFNGFENQSNVSVPQKEKYLLDTYAAFGFDIDIQKEINNMNQIIDDGILLIMLMSNPIC